VLLVPDGEWPSTKFLIPGSHSKGYIQLNDSFILKEIWRQLTGLPPVTEPIQDELNKLLRKERKEDKEDKK
jgi:hypothetical protein